MIRRLLSFTLLAGLGCLSQARAEFTPHWSLGNHNMNPQEFGSETWGTNAAPGSATARDNDFYFAGTYPAPIGTVAVSEPWTNLEGAVSTGNPLTRFHFNLSAAQAKPTLRMRFVVHLVWGGWWNETLNETGEGHGSHTLEVRINGTVVKTQTFTASGTLVAEFNAGEGGFTPVVGENILTLTRSAGTPGGWIQFDALNLEIHPTALVDADGDGLPLWWEQDHHLNDNLTADAGQDPDRDGLTNTQEFARNTDPQKADSDDDGLKDGQEVARGTNPLLADTDGDTLSDGEEVALGTNPLLADSDNDGAVDAWEVATGFNPSLSTSTPPAWNGSIGVNFISEVNPHNVLVPQAVTGYVPQLNWNNTLPLTSWNSANGTHLAIMSPIADKLVNSASTATTATMSWSSPSGFWANGQGDSSFGKLFDAYLNVNNDTGGALTFGQIPYATYDVIVYVGSVYDGGAGYVRLNDNAADDRWFLTGSTRPETRFIKPVRSSAMAPWRGNTIHFRNVTGSSFNVKMYRTLWHEVGIHGIQIVNATADEDGDGMPTAWELANRLNPKVNDANGDPDGDTLSNAQERLRQTDPRVADTDGDGLNDNVETGTGVWVSVTNTGTNPLIADTDGDGLTDGFEVNLKPAPTNPNLADTDGDGRSDAEEIQRRTNPVVADAVNAQMPVITTSPRTFTWNVDNVQLVWDHTRGHATDRSWGDTSLVNVQLYNSLFPTTEAFNMALRVKAGRVSYFLYSNHDAGFSNPGNPTWDIWEADWTAQPTDHKKALGFSGYGKVDISDRLRFQITGSSSGAQNAWNFTFNLINQDSGATVITRTFQNCTLATNLHNNNVTWQDRSDPAVPNRLQVSVHDGVQLYFLNTPLENTTAFAAYKDSDEDGLPDTWEDLHTLNKNNPADADVDSDNDGLTNIQEYLAGTLPKNRDSDNDGAPDGVEVKAGTDPLLVTSLPPLYHGTPAGVTGEDLNGNGMSDAWEQWVGSLHLNALLDEDNDGMSNGEEAAAGTDPYDPTSKFWVKVGRDDNDLVLRWPQLNYKTNSLRRSHDLTSWSVASSSPVLTGNEYRQIYADALTSPIPTFYRAAIHDVDSDSDGVSDWAEVNVLGSNPNVANSTRSPVSTDSNGDGIPDSTVSGDYASFLDQFHGSSGTGGFPGGNGGGVSRTQASRFLMQAAFGPTLEDINRVQTLGYAGWIAEQAAKTPTLQATYIKAIYQDMVSQRAQTNYNRGGEGLDPFLFGNNMMTAFARSAIQGEDQLRQRVAFALSQILVTSRRDANLENRCLGMADYYDIFVRHAFGNYFDVLMEVTMHPVMGRYLSHVGNQKEDPSINRYPDENYAREVMQLFTVGLWKLNPDGTHTLDGNGQSIPTYSNAQITQMARVMTGFWFGGHYWGGGGWTEADYATPMTLHPETHDFGQKVILDGYVIPARSATEANAYRDVEDAIRHLFEHPNTPVFVGRQLIQFLVTDNPSPEYVQRVAAVFADNGQGVRGDLAAVVKAILLDDEARDPGYTERLAHGRLKEPVIRAMALARAFGMKEVPDLLWWDWGDFANSSRQEPTNSPSVFNFYRPDYRAPGLLTQQDLAGPVFQITDSFSSIAFPNKLWQMVEEGFTQWNTYRFPMDLSREAELASDPERLVDHLNLLFCGGRMKLATRTKILTAVQGIPADQPSARAQIAAYLTLVCPEGAVMK